MIKIIVLFLLLLFILTGCNSGSTSPTPSCADVCTPTTIANTADTNTYLENDPEQSIVYNSVIATYNAFLRGESAAQSGDGKTSTVLQYGLNDDGIVSYSLGDVNNDNVPELFIHGHHYHILAFDGTQLVEWYDSQSWQPIYLLENGAVWHVHSSVNYNYSYVTFDDDGILENIFFTQPYEGDPNLIYYFRGNGISGEVSKDDWDDLTKPYFKQAKNVIELNWIEWK